MSFEQEDVLDGSSPQEENQNEQQPAESNDASSSNEEAHSQVKEDNVPFHMHPRFQEIIADKRQLKEQNEQFQRQLQEMQRQLQSLNKPEAPKSNPVRERLTGIDKEFAEYVGSVEKIPQLEQQLQEFQQWKQEQALRSVQAEASSVQEKFYSENKVPAEHREIYTAQLQAIASSDPNLKVSDLPKVLKGIHDKMTKLFQSTQREATKNLVESKKADAARPSTQPKGAPAKAGQQSAPQSKAELREQIIKDTMAEIRAAKNI